MSRCILSKGSTRSHLILLELVVFLTLQESFRKWSSWPFSRRTNYIIPREHAMIAWGNEFALPGLLVDVLQIVETWKHTVAWVMWRDCAFSRGKWQYVDSLWKSLSNLWTNQEFMVPAMFVAGYHNLPPRLQKGTDERFFPGLRRHPASRCFQNLEIQISNEFFEWMLRN